MRYQADDIAGIGHNHVGQPEHGLDSEAVEALQTIWSQPWADLKPSIVKRDDVKPILNAIEELHQLERKLKRSSDDKLPVADIPKRAANRVRWALVLRASFFDLTPTARKMLPLVLDRINRAGFVGWQSWNGYAEKLGIKKQHASRAIKEIQDHDLVRATGGHRTRLMWSPDQELIVAGGRGASYTFGKAGFDSFEALIDANDHSVGDQQGGADGDLELPAAVTSNVVKLPGSVTSTANSDDLKLPASVTSEKPKLPAQVTSTDLKLPELVKQEELESFKPESQVKPESRRALTRPSNKAEGQPSEDQVQANDNDKSEAASGHDPNNSFPLAKIEPPTPLPPAHGQPAAPDQGALAAAADLFTEPGDMLTAERRLDLPTVIAVAIAANTAPMAIANLVDAVRAARKRGVLDHTIEADIRKAVGDTTVAREDQGQNVTPSSLMAKAVRYLERSKVGEPLPVAETTKANAGDLAKLLESPRVFQIGKDWLNGATAEAALSFLPDDLRAAVGRVELIKAGEAMAKRYDAMPDNASNILAWHIAGVACEKLHGPLSKHVDGKIWRQPHHGLWCIPIAAIDRMYDEAIECARQYAIETGQEIAEDRFEAFKRSDPYGDLSGAFDKIIPMMRWKTCIDGYGAQATAEAVKLFRQIIGDGFKEAAKYRLVDDGGRFV